MRVSEIDLLRAGVSSDQLDRELAMTDADNNRLDSWASRLENVASDRLGRRLCTEYTELDDAGTIGALVSMSERPLSRPTMMRSLGWDLDRLDTAIRDLAGRLSCAGMGLFEYLDESLQIGALADGLNWEQAQRDEAAKLGVTVSEATLLRHVICRTTRVPDGLHARPMALRRAVKASLIRETETRLEANFNIFDPLTTRGETRGPMAFPVY